MGFSIFGFGQVDDGDWIFGFLLCGLMMVIGQVDDGSLDLGFWRLVDGGSVGWVCEFGSLVEWDGGWVVVWLDDGGWVVG